MIKIKLAELEEKYPIKRIPNFSAYLADKKGNIYSMKKGRIKKLSNGDTYRGYACVGLKRDDGVKVTKKVHHLVLETFVGPKPSPFHLARHLNDDGYDNRLENLVWGTNEENIEDQKRNGRTASNKRNYRNYFDTNRKLIFMKLYNSNLLTVEEICDLLRVSQKHVKHMVGEELMKNLTDAIS